MKRPIIVVVAALLATGTGCSDANTVGDGDTSPQTSVDATVGEGSDEGTTNGHTASHSDASSPDAAVNQTRAADAQSSPPEGDTSGPATPPSEDCGECFHPAVCIAENCVMPEPGGCTPGDTGECHGFDALMTCDDTGTAFLPVPCPAGESCDDGACKLLVCEPESWVCQGVGAKKQCALDGTGFGDPVDCPPGEYCSEGKCAGSCAPDPKFGAYVGCTFWSVDLPNYPDFTISPTPEDLPHAIVVSNPGEADAEVSFEPPPGVTIEVTDPVVPAGESRVFLMPLINVSDTGVSQSGILVSSTRSVLVHQFNPWDNTASNDASLLIPEPFLGKKYVVLSWGTAGLELLPIGAAENQAGYFTVVATEDDTNVTIQVTANVKAGPGVSAMSPGMVQTITLNRGEVLNVEAEPLSLFDSADLTGSTISANKPIAAFGGHEEAVVAVEGGEEQPCCADHLEEQLLPIETLDSSYVLVKAKPRGGEPDVWRIQAAEAGVSLTTTPSISGLDGVTLASKGDWVQVETELSFELQGTGPLQVGQYLTSQGETQENVGDASLILAIPSARYRSNYVLMVPDDYPESNPNFPPTSAGNWITIIKESTTTVSIDGVDLPESDFFAVGSGDWQGGYAQLPPGVIQVEGTAPFGVSAYGFSNAVSYGYPGGMSAPGE